MNHSGHSETKQKLIDEGHKQFSMFGPKMSINAICKSVGVSRASYYHFFGDHDDFYDEICQKQIEICSAFDQRALKECKQLVPDLYQIMQEYPVELRFNIQLFRNTAVPKFQQTFYQIFRDSGQTYGVALLIKAIGPTLSWEDGTRLWEVAGESWYSRLDPDNLDNKSMEIQASEILKALDFIKK